MNSCGNSIRSSNITPFGRVTKRDEALHFDVCLSCAFSMVTVWK